MEPPILLRFGAFELDLESGQLLKEGRLIRLQPQPFKLLLLLTTHAGRLLTREEIRGALWKDDTFVDFEQGVNFAIKQVRDALGDQADHPIYVQTVPKRGYRFLPPVTAAARPGPEPLPIVDQRLHKALWANIVELRLAEKGRQRRQVGLTIAFVLMCLLLAAVLVLR
jgi:DNA-binding winged helix-turn-helix (wHTH) protein